MSLPPVVIKIKRKATDEPVETLRRIYNFKQRLNTNFGLLDIRETATAAKRQRKGTNFVFTRQPTTNNGSSATSQLVFPPIAPLQLPASAPSLAILSKTQQKDGEQSAGVGAAKDPITVDTSKAPPDTLKSTPASARARHFHISRSASSFDSITPLSGRKRKAEPTIFVERKERSRPSSRENSLELPTPAEPARPRKKPGLAARSATPPINKPLSVPQYTQAPLRNVRLPSGAVLPWDVDDERLAKEMQAYTLQEIGKSIVFSEAAQPAPKPSPFRKSATSRFKPKAPALRYAERHPEEQINNGTSMDVDNQFVEEEDDDSEYIIETYIRMPVENVENTTEEPKNIGFLILDSQPDIDEFYREEEDSEDEEEDEEEDENGRHTLLQIITILTTFLQRKIITPQTTRTMKSIQTTNTIETPTIIEITPQMMRSSMMLLLVMTRMRLPSILG